MHLVLEVEEGEEETAASQPDRQTDRQTERPWRECGRPRVKAARAHEHSEIKR